MTALAREPMVQPASVPDVGSPASRRTTIGGRFATHLARGVLAVLVVAVALSLRLPELDRYATIDESRWVGRAADFAAYLQARDLDNTYLVGHPGVTTMWLGSLGMAPEQLHAFSYRAGQTDVTRRDGYLAALVNARRAALLANALLLGLLSWLAWGLFGPGAAVLGSVLLVLDPFLAAHSRFIHLDALLTSFMSVAVLSSVAFWQARSNRRWSWAYLVVAGLVTGLAVLTKAPSVFLLLFLPALALVEHWRSGGWRRPAGWLRLVAALTVWLGVAWATCLALWPALRLEAQAVLRQMVEFTVRNGGGERDNFFLGQPLEDPGPLFYPLALLFRATPLLLIGVGLLAFFLIRRGRSQPWVWPAILLGAYVVGFLLMMTLGQKKFDRYELPVFPALNLLAGLGLWLGWRALRIGRPRRGMTAIAALVVAAWPLASVYPYYLAYYNPLLGGGPAAQRAVFVGWGEGLDQAAAYLNAKRIELGAPTAATAYHRVLQAHLNSLGAMPLERAELADYIITYVNSSQRNQKAELLDEYVGARDPEHVVWINGIEYARIYPGPHLAAERVVGADYEGRVRLETVVLAPGSARLRAGDELTMRARWRPAGDPGGLVQVLRLTAPDQRVVLREQLLLSRGLREAGLLVTDTTLKLPVDLAPGEYRLEMAVDNPAAGGRPLPLFDGSSAHSIVKVAVGPAVAR